MNFTNALFLLVVAIFSIITPSLARSYQLNEEVGALRTKRDHGHGITGPVHTYVKTDKHANFKWGVRHHVGKHYAGRR